MSREKHSDNKVEEEALVIQVAETVATVQNQSGN